MTKEELERDRNDLKLELQETIKRELKIQGAIDYITKKLEA